MIAYVHHHIEACGIRHLVMRVEVKNRRTGKLITGVIVKGKHPSLQDNPDAPWGQIFVVDLKNGREYGCNDGNESREEAQPWVFDPLLRALKVAEFKKQKRNKK